MKYLKSEIFPYFEFTVNGDVRPISEDIELPIVENNRVCLTLPDGSSDCFDLNWLGLLTHYRTPCHESILKNLLNIEFQKVDNKGIYKNRMFLNNHVMVFRKPIAIGEYRVVPCFPFLCINKDGKIRNTMTGVEYEVKKYEYLEINVNNITIGQHRLLALVWLINIDFGDKPIVNHKDGNKYNNELSNLEWCSYRENNRHSVKHGLSGNNIKCKVRDFDTGVIFEYNSIVQMLEELRLPYRTSILEYLNRRPQNLWYGKYEIRLEMDSRPWFYENRTNRFPDCRYLISVLSPDGKVKEYPGYRRLIKEFKLWNINNRIDTIISAFKERYPEYEISYLDLSVGSDFKTRSYKKCSFRATNVENGNVVIVNSLREGSRVFGMDRCKIKHGLNTGKVKNNWKFDYL